MSQAFSSPKEVVLQMALREGMRVADFGTGTGHYALAAASLVGSTGRVYAVDVQEDILKHLKLNLHDRHKNTIQTIWGDVEKLGGSHLRDNSLDAVIFANAFFQVENRQGVLEEIKRVLKAGGKLLVVDWAGSYGGIGPTPEMLVPEHEMEDYFIEGGFYKVKSYRAGAHHYACLFTAP